MIYRQPPILKPGATIYSGQMNALAASWNDRLAQGPGDPWYSIAYMADSFTGMIRNSDSGGNLFPPRHEWMKLYAQTRKPWVVAGPGEPQGLNVSSPLAGFYTGQEHNDLPSEAARLSGESVVGFTGDEALSVPLNVPTSALTQVELWSLAWGEPTTDREFWLQGRKQRGVSDGVTERSPFALASQGHFPLVPNYRAKLGITFGGFTPSPKVVGNCPVDEQSIPEPVYEFTFRPLKEGLLPLVYRGFCSTANPSQSLSDLVETPNGYVLQFQDNRVEVLDYDDYLLVLNGTAYLSHQPRPWFGQGRQYLWDLIFTKFISEFKGDDDIRLSPKWKIEQTSVAWEKMGSRQSLLAPARGTVVGGSLVEVRTRFKNGDEGFKVGSESSYSVASGFTVVGVFVEGVISTTVTVRVLADGKVVSVIRCIPGEAGGFEILRILKEDYQGVITVDALGDISGEVVAVELIELVQREMTIQEFYVLARLAGAQAGDIDVLGGDWVNPKVMSDGYFKYGALVNSAAPGLNDRDDITSNGIYETARHLIDGYVKLGTRDQLEKYGVEVKDGKQKSVFYLRRRVMNPNDRDSDLFDRMGPSDTPLHPEGTIVVDRTYIVDSPAGGSVDYNGETYFDLAVFTGVKGQQDFEPTDSAFVYEYEGILTEAPERGLSNEWVMGMTFCPFSESGLYSPDNYADILGNLSNPAHLFSTELRRNGRYYNPRLSDILAQISIGQSDDDGSLSDSAVVRELLVSKSPSRLNFAKGFNGAHPFLREPDKIIGYYKSLQMYRDPYQIESIVPVRENGKWDIVKITLDRRLDHHAHVGGRNFSTSVDHWKIADDYQWLHQEPFATDESRIMKYLLWRDRGEGFAPVLGDLSASAWADKTFDVTRGNYLPFFHFVKLIETVHEDGNMRENPVDTDTWADPFLHMAFCAPICESFIDAQSTEAQVCERIDDLDLNPPTLFEYSIPETCRQAFGGRAFEFLPSRSRKHDRAWGASALPNTDMWVESYNQFSQFIRLLTRVRLDLPLTIEEQTITTNGVTVVTSPDGASSLGATNLGDGERVSLGPFGGGWAVWTGEAAYSGENEVIQPWFPFEAFDQKRLISSKSTVMASFLVAQGGQLHYAALGTEVKTHWRIQPGQMAIHAIPLSLRAVALSTPGLLLRQYDTVRKAGYTLSQGDGEAKEDHMIDGVLSPGEFTELISQGAQWDNQSFTAAQQSAGWQGIQVTLRQTQSTDCFFLASGVVQAPSPGAAAIVFQSPENHVVVSSERIVVPVGDQVGNGNLFLTIPTQAAEL